MDPILVHSSDKTKGYCKKSSFHRENVDCATLSRHKDITETYATIGIADWQPSWKKLTTGTFSQFSQNTKPCPLSATRDKKTQKPIVLIAIPVRIIKCFIQTMLPITTSKLDFLKKMHLFSTFLSWYSLWLDLVGIPFNLNWF